MISRDYEIEWWIDDTAPSLVLVFNRPDGLRLKTSIPLQRSLARDAENPWPTRPTKEER